MTSRKGSDLQKGDDVTLLRRLPDGKTLDIQGTIEEIWSQKIGPVSIKLYGAPIWLALDDNTEIGKK